MAEGDTGIAKPSVDEAFVRAAIEQADLNILRIALYQATGDTALRDVRLAKKPMRGGSFMIDVVVDEDAQIVKDRALSFWKSGARQSSATPSQDQLRALMREFTLDDLDEGDLRFGVEELAFDDFPRAVQWRNRPADDVLAQFRVVVIGAGISGIAAAIQLKQLGIPFTVVERLDGIGGTWRLNRYPEARVDVSSFIYQFRFEKHYPWTEFFPTQPEVLKYLEHVVAKHDILSHFRFNTHVDGARWDEAQSKWLITLRSEGDAPPETLAANVMVSGSGLFSTPNLPDIEGFDQFEGPVFHTAGWREDIEFDGKHVALIGTGSSGAQLMPWLAERAVHLDVYQRTPNWVVAAEYYREAISPGVQWLFDTIPNYWNWFGYAFHAAMAHMQAIQTYDADWQAKGGQINEKNDAFRGFLLDYMNAKIGDRPDLLAKCTPSYAPWARRMVIDNGWYDALRRDTVDLVSDPIVRISRTGIVTADGVERPCDIIVLGSGFKTAQYLWPVEYRGRGDVTLERLWSRDGARAYMGIAMPGFPNFFMYYGPNGQPRSGGFHPWAEVWTRYIVGAIVKMIESGHASMECKQGVFEDYNRRMDAATDSLIWGNAGAGSYYLNEHGRSSVNMPWTINEMHGWLVEPDMEDYRLG